jgi:AbrB family looped-hinge helix DNA binding protein
MVGVVEFMPVLAVTRVGRYYRTTIPREVRKLLGINENDEIEWVFEGNKVIIRKKGG